jgi:GNAT superfamily N-acetyltransferase
MLKTATLKTVIDTAGSQRSEAPALARAQAVSIVRVSSRRDSLRWLRFPLEIYPPESPWVAPLSRLLLKRLSPRNPFFRHAVAERLLAVDGEGRVLGRILAHLNFAHIVRFSEQVGFFGFFECVDDPRVARALLDAAGDFVRQHGCTLQRGPFNMTPYQEVGILLEGFDQTHAVGEAYTAPYYPRLMEAAGLSACKHMSTFTTHLDRYDPGPLLGPKQQALLRDPRFSIRSFRPAEFKREIERFGDLLNVCYYDSYHYVTLSREEILHEYGGLKALLRPELVLAAELHGVPVGFMIGLPDIYEPLHRLRGRLSPLSLLRLRRELKRIRGVSAALAGVAPHLHSRGIYRLLFHRLMENAKRLGYDTMYWTWIGDDNPGPLAMAAKAGQRKQRLAVYERPLT